MDHGFEGRDVRVPGGAVIHLYGKVVTTTSGTVGSYSVYGAGALLTIAKTGSEAGRYTFTLVDAGDTALTDLTLLHVDATVVAADDAALTDAKGTGKVIRDIDVGAGADDGTFELQFVDADSGADAELQDAAEFTFMVVLGHKSKA